ncbi:uncharacterized protein LOC103828958 isoform X2 [Brassica rapa]|uniref:uncharacterized protein LOC103828958 isoform X2 n=1 Tax=Brassica campestris TaxID=3711 RepID=UPI0004F18B8F|nr:uncharacterized protein LOC103828958 isoform X2 [Brassica rapa]XP_009102849.1 uncharacterized protein LOC103828958 isoform X2 [Brassica rapa]
MPPGAKKRKALKKKKKQQKQQEPTVTSTNTKGSTNGDNHHEKGHDENGRQDDRGSDDSSLSSPASQGSGEFGEAKDPSGLVNDTAKEISDHVTQGLGPKNGIERGKDDKKNSVDLASQDACGYSIKEITPVAEPEKTEHAETSTHSNLVNKKSDGTKEYPSPEKDNGKVAATLPGFSAGTSRNVESLIRSEVPVSSEEKRLLLTRPPAVRTSWLSCCGLFDAVTGSDR